MATVRRPARAPAMDRPQQIDFPGVAITAADTVVDVGCGEGVVCAYAGRRGADVIGIDIDPECIRRADEAMRGVPARSWRGLVGDADPIPLPDGVATVVVATEVLEHVDDPPRLLAELVRIGRPGARYVLSVPAPASESVLKIVAPRWYFEKPYHQRIYEDGQLEALAEAAGLEVAARACYGFESALGWIFRMALGASRGEPPPDAPLLTHWDATLSELRRTSRGQQLVEALDERLPKSRVVVARKPGRRGWSPGGSAFARERWRRLVRDGLVQLGGYEVRWKVRRVRAGESGGVAGPGGR
jgi:SAM-dependent methyltransferase